MRRGTPDKRLLAARLARWGQHFFVCYIITALPLRVSEVSMQIIATASPPQKKQHCRLEQKKTKLIILSWIDTCHDVRVVV